MSPPGDAPRTPALFLDRDGVINFDRGYVHRVDQFEFVPGIFELVRCAAGELGWPAVVATNQSGIGRGYFDQAAYDALTTWIEERFRAENAPLTRVYHCPYHPERGVGRYRADHPWRKPRPGMFLQAADDLSLDLARSVAIGDQMSDVAAAAAAGIGLCLRLDAQGTGADPSMPPHTAIHSLGEAIPILRAHGCMDRNKVQ